MGDHVGAEFVVHQIQIGLVGKIGIEGLIPEFQDIDGAAMFVGERLGVVPMLGKILPGVGQLLPRSGFP